MSWWRRFRLRNPSVPVAQFLCWELFWRPVLWFYLFFCYRIRTFGANRVPATGPTLLVCNHQSFLDLIMIGVLLPRHYHSMARKTLFEQPLFAWIITHLNAFPVDQEKGDTAAMKEAMKRMRENNLVLVFPEGSRTPDGEIHEFQRGIWLLIKRVKPTIVPAAVGGAFHAWRRGRKLPRVTGRVGVQFGEPIPAEELIKFGPDAGIAELESTVKALHDELCEKIKTAGPTAMYWNEEPLDESEEF